MTSHCNFSATLPGFASTCFARISAMTSGLESEQSTLVASTEPFLQFSPTERFSDTSSAEAMVVPGLASHEKSNWGLLFPLGF